MQGSGACWPPGAWGPPAPEMLERRREPPHRTVALKSTAEKSGGPQGSVGQVSRGLGARAPGAWGPAQQGPGAFSP